MNPNQEIPFSATPPTEPGAYYYKATQQGEIHVGEVLFSASRQKLCFTIGDGFHWSVESLDVGEWSPPLIPRTLLDEMMKEVQLAYWEGSNHVINSLEKPTKTIVNQCWSNSRAKKISEGR